MKDNEYYNLIEMTYAGGGFLPANEAANLLMERCKQGEVLTFIEKTPRDLEFMKCYFSLLHFIYDLLPMEFKLKAHKKIFYLILKHLAGDYNIKFEFKDGSKLIEYHSISFGRMSQKTFENYVAEQLPFIYENVICKMFEPEKAKEIIDLIETEYERFLSKL
jgi:hypothetical protein